MQAQSRAHTRLLHDTNHLLQHNSVLVLNHQVKMLTTEFLVVRSLSNLCMHSLLTRNSLEEKRDIYSREVGVTSHINISELNPQNGRAWLYGRADSVSTTLTTSSSHVRYSLRYTAGNVDFAQLPRCGFKSKVLVGHRVRLV